MKENNHTTQQNTFELLAPAGSLAIFKAVVAAGADAVYVGGSKFGARAYADNFSDEELLEALDYAHLYGRRVYLTVNTLLKNSEIEQVCAYLQPFYEHGLDAVLVQDFGVLTAIHERFPDLAIHTSTQMTVTGVEAARLFSGYGVTRMVMARELSLNEMKRIREETGMELKHLYTGRCVTVIPDSVCLAVCLEEEAETAADVHSHAGFLTQCWMKSTGNTKKMLMS